MAVFKYCKINWYNEKQDAFYTLTSYGERILTKEQFLQLARELLEKSKLYQ
jgi:hypothetical protein